MPTTELHSAMSQEEVLEHLTGRHRLLIAKAVFSVTRGISVDHESLLDEVCSELAIRMLSGRFARFDPSKASFSTYLAAAARNAARDILHHTSCRTVSLDGAPASVERVDCATPDRILEQQEHAEAMQETVRRLEEIDPESMGLLRAMYVEDIDSAAIAERNGLPSAQSLYLRLHRAKRRLAALLDPAILNS